MTDIKEPKSITMMDVFSIHTDLCVLAEQNSRMIQRKASHLMGIPREMRVDFGPTNGGVSIFLPVLVGDYIYLFKNVHVVQGTWRPWKKAYLSDPEFELVDIKSDDASLDPLREGLTIV